MATADLGNPILNSLYELPASYFELGDDGPTGIVLPRPPAERVFIPIPVSKKAAKAASETPDFDVTGGRREPNASIGLP